MQYTYSPIRVHLSLLALFLTHTLSLYRRVLSWALGLVLNSNITSNRKKVQLTIPFKHTSIYCYRKIYE